MTVQRRIFIAALLWTGISLVAGCHVLISLNALIRLQNVSSTAYLGAHAYQRLYTIMINMETGIRGYLLSGNDTYLEPFNEAEGLFDAEAKRLVELASEDSNERAQVERIIALKQEWMGGPVMEEMLARRKLSRGMITPAEFTAIFQKSKGKSIMDELRNLLNQKETGLRKKSEAMGLGLVEKARETQISTALALSLSVMIGFATLVSISRKTTHRVNLSVEVLDRLSQDISQASREVSKNSQSLTHSSEKVSSAIDHTYQSVKNILEFMSINAGHAKASKNLLGSCQAASNVGMESAQRTMGDIHEIESQNALVNQMFDDNRNRMRTLLRLIESIAEKTQVIHEIVFQTKLLSFNASVEAARAGEHGRGFSVVSLEVGKLAELSGKAAQSISEIVNLSIQEAQTMQEALDQTSTSRMREFSERIAKAIGNSKVSARNLESIQSQIEHFSDYMSKLLESSEAQSHGLSDIKDSMQIVQCCTQENHLASKESAQVSVSLSRHIHTLHSTVSTFNKLFNQNEAKEDNVA